MCMVCIGLIVVSIVEWSSCAKHPVAEWLFATAVLLMIIFCTIMVTGVIYMMDYITDVSSLFNNISMLIVFIMLDDFQMEMDSFRCMLIIQLLISVLIATSLTVVGELHMYVCTCSLSYY